MNGKASHKIGLGTVQFGLDYGISNTGGQVSRKAVGEILELAADQGLDLIDTAALYGESESVLGQLLPKDHPFAIVTKTAKANGERVALDDIIEFQRVFDRSLERLRQSSVYALLVHQTDDLFKPGGREIIAFLEENKTRGQVEKIGISVYTIEQIHQALNFFTPDLIQLPINVLDQRLLSGGMLRELVDRDIEIHARSIFLQGLLLMPPDTLDPFFDPVRDHLKTYHADLASHNLSPVAGALQAVLQLPEIYKAIIGVCAASELQEIIDAAAPPPTDIDFTQYAIRDTRYITPSNWRLNHTPASSAS